MRGRHTPQDAKVRDANIDGADVEVYVDADNGEFYCRHAGEIFKAPSYKALVDKVRKFIRTHQRINIPVTLLEEYHSWDDDGGTLKVLQVSLTGLHGRNANVLYKQDKDGVTGQESHSRNFYRRMTGAEVQELFRLRKARREATKALNAFLEERQVNARELIKAAQAALDPETAHVDATSEEY